MPFKVIQFSTGNVGEHALRQIIESPHLELVGVHANGVAKQGRDAAELCGLTALTGVRATNDIAALIAAGADCVVYTSQGEPRIVEAIDEMSAFLRAGINVVATSPVWLIYPPAADAWLRDPLVAACEHGGSTMYVSGIDPGFSGDMLPMAALGLCQSATSILVQEIFDYGTYDDAEFTGVSMGFGFTPDQETPLMFLPGVLSSIWGGPVEQLAECLGVRLDELRERYEAWATPVPISCTMMDVAPGHIAAVRFAVEGIKDGEPVIVMEHVNRLTMEAAPEWPYPPEGRRGVHRVLVTGRPGVEINVHVGGDDIDLNQGGVMSTAAKVVNAIPAVCAAPPGLTYFRDLPVAQMHGLVR